MKHRINIYNRLPNLRITVEIDDDGQELEDQTTRVIHNLNNIDDLTAEDIWSIETYYGKNN